jgi:hypothetical protein
VESGTLDGSLYRWDDIAEEYDWRTLFIGNGLSINLWPNFGYGTLVEHASLTSTDQLLFQGEETPNFELVLADINTAIWVAALCDSAKSPAIDAMERSFNRIREALGRAVRAVHPRPADIPNTALIAIRNHLLKYGWVFTTSYDLLVYWAMGSGPHGFSGFTDLFLYRHAGRYQFDEWRARTRIPSGRTAVCFLHGALHLVVGQRGVTWKLTRGADTLLRQIDRPIADESHARRLLVTEGSYRDKLRVIDANDYLNHTLQRLREQDSPLVVFGSRLSDDDRHLVNAINENPKRPVAVSVYPRSKREVARAKNDVLQRLETNSLLFYDSTTHPLGLPGLRAAPR